MDETWTNRPHVAASSPGRRHGFGASELIAGPEFSLDLLGEPGALVGASPAEAGADGEVRDGSRLGAAHASTPLQDAGRCRGSDENRVLLESDEVSPFGHERGRVHLPEASGEPPIALELPALAGLDSRLKTALEVAD